MTMDTLTRSKVIRCMLFQLSNFFYVTAAKYILLNCPKDVFEEFWHP